MDLAAADEDGITPPYAAVLNANPAVTDAALVGTNSDMFSANGHTPLHWAAWLDQEEQTLHLLDAGADPALKDDQGWIPFDLANHPRGAGAGGDASS